MSDSSVSPTAASWPCMMCTGSCKVVSASLNEEVTSELTSRKESLVGVGVLLSGAEATGKGGGGDTILVGSSALIVGVLVRVDDMVPLLVLGINEGFECIFRRDGRERVEPTSDESSPLSRADDLDE